VTTREIVASLDLPDTAVFALHYAIRVGRLARPFMTASREFRWTKKDRGRVKRALARYRPRRPR
jgi:hypothetical protein